MIRFEGVSKRFGAATALADLDLSVARGELCALVGSSGGGKTTALRLVNRLLDPDSGRVLVDGVDTVAQPAVQLRRRIGYVIQSVGLFPHWNVARNVAVVPSLLGWTAREIASRVEELMTLVGLDPAVYRDRRPHELSGGQQQRVGVARALAARPDVLLMDEPFGALDPVTRAALQVELARIHRETGTTILLVTHDIDEALRLAGRIAILDRGRLLQCGTPREILAAPADPFVREFVGGPLLGLRLLSVVRAADALRPGSPGAGAPVDADCTLDQALATMVERGCDALPVRDAGGALLGALHLADIVRLRDRR